MPDAMVKLYYRLSTKLLLSVFLILLLSSSVFGGVCPDGRIRVNNDLPTVDGVRGSSIRIPVLVTNNAPYGCTLKCTLDFEGDRTNFPDTSSGATNGLIEIYTVPSNAKDRKLVKVSVACKLTPLIDLIDIPLVDYCRSAPQCEISLEITPKLTDQEQSIKDGINSIKDPLVQELKILDEKSLTFTNKRTQLQEQKVKIRDIVSEYQSIASFIQETQNLIESIEKKVYDWDYISAKNELDRVSLPEITRDKSTVDSLINRLDERLRIHNELKAKIEALSGKIRPLATLAGYSRNEGDYNSISSAVVKIANTFQSGNFDSYDLITSEVNRVNSDIDQKKAKWEQALKEIIIRGANRINSEYKKLCIEKQVCDKTPVSYSGRTEDIPEICKEIKQIPLVFDKVNNKENADYQKALSDIKTRNTSIQLENTKLTELNKIILSNNTQVDRLNSKISELNTMIGNISERVITNSLSTVDLEGCRNAINSFGGVTVDKKIGEMDTVKNECNILSENVKRAVAETESSLWSRFLRYIRTNIFKKDTSPLQIGFNSVSYVNRQGLFELKPYLSINITKPTKIVLSEDIKSYSDQYCGKMKKVEASDVKISAVSIIEPTNIKSDIDFETKEKESECNIFGENKPCCTQERCANNPHMFPIIFVHGHAPLFYNDHFYSIEAFKEFQEKLNTDKKYVSEEFILPDTIKQEGEWSNSPVPITIRATYYQGVYDSRGLLTGEKEIGISIDEYARRLSKIVSEVKKATGRNKVNIIAHSMGGLVSRAYIEKFGGASEVNKLVTIGTPNLGVIGRGRFCGLLNVGTSNDECIDMIPPSQFLSSLQQSINKLPSSRHLNVVGNGCIDSLGQPSDGIVLVSKASLPSAENYEVRVDPCPNTVEGFHRDLVSPDKFPRMYTKIVEFLKG